ncbi:MAG: ribosome biogenesis GTPase Der, partial [bacterium]
MKDLIVIMGRPNVGKSTFLNRLIGKRAAITLDEPGMTRDLLSYDWTFKGKTVTLMDTGGVFLGAKTKSFFQDAIESKVSSVLDEATLIFFMVDAKEGVHPYDEQIMQVLQRVKEKVIVLVNKVDEVVHEDRIQAFYTLGFSELFAVSAAHGKGVAALQQRVFRRLTVSVKKDGEERPPKLSILGQPNTGKSSLANALFGKDWVLVSDQAGTTRDVVQVPVMMDGKSYVLLDTAGLRRKSKVKHPIEFFSGLRARQSILDSDLCMVLLDASLGISQQDKRILQLVLDEAKPLVVVVNKWDLMEDGAEVKKDFMRFCRYEMPRLEYYPFCFISTVDQHGFPALRKTVQRVLEAVDKRVSTSE